MFRLLQARKLNPVVIRFLIRLYTNQSIRVRWASHITELCTVTNGVKQGGVISPIMFTIYIDELLCRLKKSRVGCHIGHTFCGALGYADDVVLLAPTLSSVDVMLDICKDFAAEYDMIFNSAKSRHIQFPVAVNPSTVSFMDSDITQVTSDKHLGNIVGPGCHADVVSDATHKFIGMTNSVKSHFGHIRTDDIYRLFKVMCMPLYGSQLWDLTHRSTEQFHVTWRKSVRRTLDLPYRTHSDMLPYICNDMPLPEQLYSRIVSLIRGLHNSNNRVTKLCYQLVMRGSKSSVCNSVSVITEYYGVTRDNVHRLNCSDMSRMSYISENAIQSSVIRDMLDDAISASL